MAPKGFESLNNNSKPPVNKQLTRNSNSVLAINLDKTLQKYPELRELIKVWPELPEQAGTEVKNLIKKKSKNGVFRVHKTG